VIYGPQYRAKSRKKIALPHPGRTRKFHSNRVSFGEDALPHQRGLGAVAELEHNLIKERIAMGLDRARKEKKVLGRPRKIFDHEKAVGLQAGGKSLRQIAEVCRSGGHRASDIGDASLSARANALAGKGMLEKTSNIESFLYIVPNFQSEMQLWWIRLQNQFSILSCWVCSYYRNGSYSEASVRFTNILLLGGGFGRDHLGGVCPG
jgi:hypothetical protein